MIRALIVLMVGFLVGCGPPIQYKVKKNVSYQDGNPAAIFDFYEPPYDVGNNRPLLIAIHGGAWQIGDKKWGKKVAEKFCYRGYCVASINYRLAPNHKWPAQIEDVQAALKYFRSAAWMKIDNDRIASFGTSAGGHLASMLCLRGKKRKERVKVCVSIACGGDFVNNRDQDDALKALLGDNLTKELLADISPVTFARKDSSILLIHSIWDQNVSFNYSNDLFKALSLAGADVQFLAVFSSKHSDVWYAETDQIESFLDARLNPHTSGRRKQVYKLTEKIERKFK